MLCYFKIIIINLYFWGTKETPRAGKMPQETTAASKGMPTIYFKGYVDDFMKLLWYFRLL